ncbi:MAG: RNA polymerase sigma factor [Terriglobales bacterium]
MQQEEYATEYRRLYPRVLRRIRRFLADRGQAQDVAQEVLVALWRHWSEIADGDHALRWAGNAARQRALTANRNNARKQAALATLALQPRPAATRGAVPARDWVQYAACRLTSAQLEVIALFAEGRPAVEIARQLKRPLETVRTQIRRAFVALRQSNPPNRRTKKL